MLYVYRFYDLSAWGCCWFVVYKMWFIYKVLNVGPFDYTAVAGSGKVGPVNQHNHTSCVAVVTPSNRPKSVRNRCIIELFCCVVCVVSPFDRLPSYGIYISQLVLLGVVLAFWISILKISKLLQNCWHRVIDITSFEKHLESSLDHSLNFCRYLVIFRSKNICQKESLTRSSTVI